jgi:damage-control phosphatase, subfamily I
MKIYLDCIPCFIRQSLDAARHATDDVKIHEKVMRGVIGLANNLDMSQSPPVIGQKIHRLIREKLVEVDNSYHGIGNCRKHFMQKTKAFKGEFKNAGI